MKVMLICVFVVAMAAVVLHWSMQPSTVRADSDSGESLSIYMDHLQRHTHKLGLAIDAQNEELAAFYMEEINETTKYITGKFPQYDGFQVGALLPAMLTPYTIPLAKAIEGGDWKAANPAYDNMLTSGCNGCHTATQHAFVKIVRNKTNVYNQAFTP